MNAKIVEQEDNILTIQVQVKLGNSMLESEENIQQAANEVGCVATKIALGKFDTDGSSLRMGSIKWFSKGKVNKNYESPYGGFTLARHVYQQSKGGKTYCPMDDKARIILSTTPKFAKMVSHKFANMSSPKVKEDLEENHGRKTSRSYLQRISEAVGEIAQKKEETWKYKVPKQSSVRSIAIGVDGTCMLLCEEGYRQAMVGTISFYDEQGERQHTIYVGATPEYGKSSFLKRMEREIVSVKSLYPQANYLGIADGAKDNWIFLEKHTETQILDFYHATGYLYKVANAAYPRSKASRQVWNEQKCHELKNEGGAANKILNEMLLLRQAKLSKKSKESLESAITYFSNHLEQMNYAKHIAQKHPIGSGVTEAACKTLVKERLCESGMKWKERGASLVLSIRALVMTTGRWNQFWNNISRFGIQRSTSKA